MQKRILRLYGLALIVGLLTGLASTLFRLAITAIQTIFEQIIHWQWLAFGGQLILSIALTVCMMLAAYIITRRYAPEAKGSGVPEIQGALIDARPINWRRLLPVKFIGGALALGAHMTLGREGPTIQMGGNLGAMIAEWGNMAVKRKKTFIVAGAAAGLAAAFNAPLAAMVFVLEEMRNEFIFNMTNFKIVALACIAATLIGQAVLGTQSVISMPLVDTPQVGELGWFFILGLVVGIVGLGFNKLLMLSLNKSAQWNLAKSLTFITSVSVIIGFGFIVFPDAVGDGFSIIQNTGLAHSSLLMLSVLTVVRFVLLILCYNTGVPGGIFAPLLSIGALLGLMFSQVILIFYPATHLSSTLFSVVGMGSLFAATIQSPLTGVLLVVEMTQNYNLIFPLLVSCITAATVLQLAGNNAIYRQLLHLLLQKADHHDR